MTAKRRPRRLPIGSRWLCALGLLQVNPSALTADVLHLTNGRQIVVDRYWQKGDQIFFELNGSIFGFPKSLLQWAESDPAPPAEKSDDPTAETGLKNETITRTLEEARQSVQEGNLDNASRLYREALAVAPDSITGRVELADLFLIRGNLQAAQSQLEQAKRIAPDEPTVREKLGNVYYRRGRTALAIREWERAMEISPNADLLLKLKKALRENDQDIEFDEIRRPQFLIRYDGMVNEAIGRAIASALDEEYAELRQELRSSPRAPITVTLYTNREFEEVTDLPAWISAVYDGEVRIPVQGIDQVTPGVRKLLRHELTHSFINARTGGNCPTWFQEGLAQFRTDESPPDLYSTLRTAREDRRIMPLSSLEGSLLHYPEEKLRLAYLESLAATQYIVRRRGRPALVEILDRLADQWTMNDALKKVVGLDYPDFQTAFEADLDRFR